MVLVSPFLFVFPLLSLSLIALCVAIPGFLRSGMREVIEDALDVCNWNITHVAVLSMVRLSFLPFLLLVPLRLSLLISHEFLLLFLSRTMHLLTYNILVFSSLVQCAEKNELALAERMLSRWTDPHVNTAIVSAFKKAVFAGYVALLSLLFLMFSFTSVCLAILFFSPHCSS